MVTETQALHTARQNRIVQILIEPRSKGQVPQAARQGPPPRRDLRRGGDRRRGLAAEDVRRGRAWPRHRLQS